MHMILTLLLSAVVPSLRDRAALQLELIALRHQLAVLERKRTTRLRLTRFDRFFWVWLYRVWPGCLDAVVIVQPEIRNTFGVAAAIQRCQVHKGRNIIERLPEHLHASVKKALRQAWEQDDADKAERLLRNLARRLEQVEPGVAGSTLEGLEEILTVIRLGLPQELRRSLACTNIVENTLDTVRQVTRNVKRWRNAEMALRWTATGLLEAQKTFRRLKAYRQLSILRNALQEHLRKAQADSAIETIMKAA